MPLLLAALVAFCPIKCLLAGCHSCGLILSEQASSDCTCCSDDPCDRPALPENDHSSPDSPDNCTCSNCFCAGALTVSVESIEFPDQESGILFESICWNDVESLVPLFPQTPPTGFFLHRLASGAELRAALSCWVL